MFEGKEVGVWNIGTGNMYRFTSYAVHLWCCGKDKGQFTVVVLICDF